jgi:uncharacterized membrane protein
VDRVSASGAEERSSSLRGGAIFLQGHFTSKAVTVSRILVNTRGSLSSFRKVLEHLFVPEQDSKFTYIALGVITFFAVVLRLYFINNPIGYDEAYTFINFSSKPFKFILADYHAPNNHILNSLLIGIAYRLLGSHEWIVRVPAFIASVLSVPAAFVAGRRFFNAPQALAAATMLAVAPTFILNAVNGRGYPFIILFTLLLSNFAGILVERQSHSALIAYAITGALGFYTIPIFLYPMAGISLWVAVTYLSLSEPWEDRWRKLWIFLIACAASGLLTLILYSPVIIFGTGFKALIANDIVKSQSWIDFLDNLNTRGRNTWQSWMTGTSTFIKQVFYAGFIISLIFFRKVSNQRLPMQLFLFIGAGAMVTLQRVAPLPRIWGYLEMFFLFFSAAGLTWTVCLVVKSIWNEQGSQKLLTSLVFVIATLVFVNVTIKTQNRQAIADRTISPEFFAADYITQHITENDTIVAVAPTDIQTAYYLKINGVPYETFYQRDHPKKMKNALVLVRTRGEYNINTLEKVIDFYQLSDELRVEAGNQVFEYGPLLIYSIPAR